MKGKTARALRRAVAFDPHADREYVYDWKTRLNRPNSERDMYLKAKQLFRDGQVHNLDKTKDETVYK